MVIPLIAGSLPANQIDTAINDTRGYIESWGMEPGVALTVARGGTGGATAAAARTNLSVPSVAEMNTALGAKVDDSEVAPGDFAIANAIPRFNNVGQLTSQNPSLSGHVVTLATLQGGFTTTGHIYLPNSTAATSGFTVAYINGDGRISRGSSSEQYKENIELVDPLSLGDIFPDLYSYTMKGDPDKVTRFGNIAERLNESDALRPFVVYKTEPVYSEVPIIDEETGEQTGTAQGAVIGSRLVKDSFGLPVPDSIDFIALGIAQAAVINARLKLIEERLAKLEG